MTEQEMLEEMERAYQDELAEQRKLNEFLQQVNDAYKRGEDWEAILR